MPRQRLLHPGYFTNPELGKLPFEARQLFQGLWCLSDREGRLEDHPVRIKLAVLPFDKADVDALLSRLEEHGFIQRYEAESRRFIQVLNFKRFQHPHPKEAQSSIPAPGYVKVTASNVNSTASPSDPQAFGSSSLQNVSSSKTRTQEPAVPPQALLDLWNDLAPPTLPRATMTRKREAKLRTRLREHPLSWWRQVFEALPSRRFFLGDNDRGWRANLDYFTRDDTVAVKFLEESDGRLEKIKRSGPGASRAISGKGMQPGSYLNRTYESVLVERGLAPGNGSGGQTGRPGTAVEGRPDTEDADGQAGTVSNVRDVSGR